MKFDPFSSSPFGADQISQAHVLAPMPVGETCVRLAALAAGFFIVKPAVFFIRLCRGCGSGPWQAGAGLPALRDGVNVRPAPWDLRGGHVV